MPAPLRIVAPAKVNLFLHITGKRPDGYHLINSLVAFTSFGDVLEIFSSDQLSLAVTGPFAPSLPLADDNLVMRAAQLLQQHNGCAVGAKMVLHKHIPIGAGLGGGSSDAAAALLGLREFWGITVSDEELFRMGLTLGSDLPVCLKRKLSRVRGVGEELSVVNADNPAWRDYWLVLVNPGQPLLTADVYRNFAGTFTALSSKPEKHSLLDFIQSGHNDLEVPAIALLPVVAEVVSVIRKTPDCLLARMSGSGATCFGLYPNEILARRAAIELQKQRPHWWVQATGWYSLIN